MKRLLCVLVCLPLASSTYAAAVNSNGTGGGEWSVPGTWAEGVVPGDGDSVTIGATDTVLFDADQSGWAAGLAGLTVNGLLTCSEVPGTYYLKMKGNIVVGAAGEIKAGTSRAVPYPQTSTMTFYFNGAYGFSNFNKTGKLNLFCTEPTYTYVKLSGAEAIGQTELSVDTNVIGDIWAAGDPVYICDVDAGNDSELRTIDTGGIAASTITVTPGLTNAKVTGAYVVLCRRNIRILGSTGTSTSIINGLASCIVDAEVNGAGCGLNSGTSCLSGGCWYGLYRGHASGAGHSISGVISGCTNGVYSSDGHSISGVISGCGNGVYSGAGTAVSGTINGCTTGISGSADVTISGTISGCTTGISGSDGVTISGTISGCGNGIYSSSGLTISGTVSDCTQGICAGSDFMFTGATLTGNTYDLRRIVHADIYHTTLAGTENYGYNTSYVPAWSYVASYDHDQVPGALKAWTRGGVVVSDVNAAPVGFPAAFKHACESADMQCFRQAEMTLEPGQTLQVAGKIKVADDHSAWAPRLEIIDPAADPLVDAANSPLASAACQVADGSVADWQDVLVTFTNAGTLGKKVIIRCSAKRASGDVYEVWSSSVAQ